MQYAYELMGFDDIRSVIWNKEIIEKLKYSLYVLYNHKFSFELYFNAHHTSIFISADHLELLDAFTNVMKSIYPITHYNTTLPTLNIKHMLIFTYALDPLFVLDTSTMPDLLATLVQHLDLLNTELAYQVLFKPSNKVKWHRRILKKYVFDAYKHHHFLRINHWSFEALTYIFPAKLYYRDVTQQELNIATKMIEKLNMPIFEVQIRVALNVSVSKILPLLNIFRDNITGQYLTYRFVPNVNSYITARKIYPFHTMYMYASELVGFVNIPITHELKLGYTLAEL